MKKIIIGVLMLIPTIAFAQTFRDDFDSNSLGWNEFVGKKYSAVIREGVLHLETSDKDGQAFATCYGTYDPQKPFEIKAKFIDTKINDEEQGVGILFNYMDDYNLEAFFLSKDKAYYWRWMNNKVCGFRAADVKFKKRSRDHELQVKSGFEKLEFIVNNVKVLEVRSTPIYTGFGIGVWSDDGKQTADVDYIEFIQ